MLRPLALAALVALAACGDPALGGLGAPCGSSEDCAAGLLCDFGRKPAQCAGDLTRPPDMSVPDLPKSDASTIDL